MNPEQAKALALARARRRRERATHQGPQAPAAMADQIAGYGTDIVSGVTALPRGAAQIISGAVGDIGHFTGLNGRS